jgi:hypothetical protein
MPRLVSEAGEVVLVVHMFSGLLEDEPISLKGSATIRAAELAAAPIELPKDTPIRIVA